MTAEAVEKIEAGPDFKDGVQMLLTQGALIAMLPIEKWMEQLERAEAVGPILDPTLYREFLYSGRGEMIRDVLVAASALKAAILKAQDGVRSGSIR